MAFSISSSEIKQIRLACGLYERADLEWYDKFFRYGCLNPEDQLTTSREYLFWTKPDLNICNSDGTLNSSIQTDSYFIDCQKRYYKVIEQLQYSLTKKPFVNLLSGTVKSSLDFPGFSCHDIEGPSTSYGDQIRYRGSTVTSEADGYDFSLEFQDTKYLEVFTFFNLWDNYENYKQMGVVSPSEEYTLNHILHNQMSLYKIVVAEDFETIIFWGKYWGVYPKNVPCDTFSNLDTPTDSLKYSINFHGEWMDFMDPLILSEFHLIAGNDESYSGGNDTIPLYDSGNNRINGVMCNTPYIIYEKSNRDIPTGGMYKLKWR